MNRIIEFVLESYSVKAKWRIIPLTYDKWKKLSTEKTAIDELAWKLEAKIKELMNNEKSKNSLRENEELERRIDKGLKMEKEIEKEYDEILTLEQNMNSSAIMMEVRPLKRLKRLRGNFPFHYNKLFKKNKEVDFIILLNVQLISGDSRREKLKTVVHEALHFIENLKKTRSDFEFIENEADRIVEEFMFSA